MSAGTGTRTIRALVVDDEPLARANLVVLLRREADIEIVGECGSGAEALQTILKQKPDLVFLDIQMPEIDGFDVLEMLGSDLPPAVIFVTAYDQYALKAFEAGALDYLLKPFDKARLGRALARAKERISSRSDPGIKTDCIVVKNAGRVSFLRVAEIDWVEAADYYVCLHVGKATHLLRRTMNELDRDLDQAAFCRIHRSTMVNVERIREIRFGPDGEYEVVLKDGTTLRLSRRYRKQLESRLGMRRPA
jgi:two-component system LytT family response regulator